MKKNSEMEKTNSIHSNEIKKAMLMMTIIVLATVIIMISTTNIICNACDNNPNNYKNGYDRENMI